MNELENKLSEIAERLEKTRAKTRFATNLTLFAYIALVAFVFAYTSFLLTWMKNEVSADKISAQMRLQLEKNLLTDEKRQKILAYCRGKIPVLADSLALSIHQRLMPAAKTKIIGMLDKQADVLAAKLKKDLLPEIKKFVADHADEFKKHSDIADERIANELAKALAAEVTKDINGVAGGKMERGVVNLKRQLDSIASKPYAKLTKKEAAERRLIVNWVYLMEHGEAPSNVAGAFLESFKNTYDSVLSDLKLE